MVGRRQGPIGIETDLVGGAVRASIGCAVFVSKQDTRASGDRRQLLLPTGKCNGRRSGGRELTATRSKAELEPMT
jgi:hypothetical protein